MDERRFYLIALLLVGIAVALFWPVARFNFVNYDDDKYVFQNPHIREGLSWKGIRWAFTADLVQDSLHADYWQPVTFLSRMIDIELYGLNPAGHHLMNLLLHLANIFLLFTLLSEMTGAVGQSALVAALFAVHPLQVEPVAWVTARKDLLATFFGLLTIRAYRDSLQSSSRGPNLKVFILFLLALMSKPVMVTLPFLMLLLDHWPLGREDGGKAVIEKWPLFLLSILFSLFPFIGQTEVLRHFSPAGVLSNIAFHYLRYLEKFFYPVRLAINTLLPETSFHPWRVSGATLFLIGFSIFVMGQARHRPYLGVGWFWYLGMLAPTIGLPRFEDRFIYLPMVGLALILVWGVSDLLATWHHRRAVLIFSAALFLSVLTSQAHTQVGYWRNSVSLFEHALEIYPKDNYIAHNQLCAAHLSRGDYEKAMAQCSEAAKSKPDAPEVQYNLALVLATQGKLEEAVRHYTEAIRLKPDYLAAHTNLGITLVRQGRRKEAIPHFLTALRLKPDSAEAHHNLGVALAGLGKMDEAMVHYKEALRLKPDSAEAHYNLANALLQQGKPEEAITHYQETLRLQPDSVEAHSTLGVLLAKQGKRDEAASHLKEALRLKPDSAEVHNNLANVLELQGDLDGAVFHYTEALRLKPDSFYFQRNLGLSLVRQGKRKEAAPHLIAAEKLNGIQSTS